LVEYGEKLTYFEMKRNDDKNNLIDDKNREKHLKTGRFSNENREMNKKIVTLACMQKHII
jgi:hypothetical protein